MEPAMLDFEIPPHLRREFIFQTAGILPPNGIVFGFRTAQKVGEQAARLGGKEIILVTDDVMVQLGYAGMIKKELEKYRFKVDVYGKVEPEPHMETADALWEMVRKKEYDLVVGLGGGSSMDMAKLAAIVATNPQSPKEIMTQQGEKQAALKKILIPTTAGTGSEVSMAIVVSAGKEKYLMRLPFALPEIAIIDPGLTVSMPPKVTASTGIDALSHAVEGIMNRLANPFYDSFGLLGIELMAKYLRRATDNGRDLEARYYMSMGAMSAMISFAGTGGLYAHSISYVLARFQPTTHGMGCGVALPYTMAFNLPVIEEKLARVARAMGEKIDRFSPGAAGWRAVEVVFDLTAGVKMPVSLKEMGFRHEDVPQMAEICMSKYPRPNNPRRMSQEECLSLLEAMWEGKIARL
jgi:alcohol dehydrogenase class IV